LLQPATLIGVVDVHVLHADRAAVGFAADREDFGKPEAVRCGQAAGVKFGIEVGVVELVKAKLQIGYLGALAQSQRIEIRALMAAYAKRIDHAQHAGLLGVIGHFRGDDQRAMLRQRFEALGDQAMAGVVGHAVEQLAKCRLPMPRDRLRIVQVLFVELLDKGSIQTGQMRSPVFPFQIVAHEIT